MAGRSVINVLVNADPRRFKKGMAEAEGALGKLGTAAKNSAKLVAGIGAAFTGASVIIGKKALDAANDFAESINAVNVTFGEAAEGIHELAEASATAVGLSSREFNAFAVQFAGFTGQLTTSEKDIVDVTDELTVRIADFASVMNLDLNEAATVFNSTLAGSSEVIRKYGIDVSAAAVENYLLEEGIASSKATITEAMKVQGRYALVMEATEKMSGDFANTSEGLANTQRLLAAEFDNSMTRLGQHLLPVMTELANFLLKHGIPALNQFIDFIGPKLETAIGDARKNLGQVRDRYEEVRDAADEMAASIRDRVNVEFERGQKFVEDYRTELSYAAGAIGGIVTALVAYQTATAAARGVTVAMTAAQLALSAVMALSPWGLIALAIAAVIGALLALRLNYQDVADAAMGVFRDLQYGLKVIQHFVGEGIEWLRTQLEKLQPVIDAVGEFFGRMRDAITDAVAAAVDAIQRNFGPIAQWFNDNVVATIEAAVEYMIILFQRIVQVVGPLLQTLASIVADVITMISNTIIGFVDTIEPIFRIFWETLKAVVVTAFEAIENTIEIALAVIRGIFEAGTALLKGDFSGVWEALKGIVEDAMAAIGDFLESWWGTTIDFFKTIPALIDQAAVGMFDGIKNAFKEAVNFIIRGWNRLEFRVPGFSIGPIGYDGFTLGVPDIPLLADGGIVNRATLAVIGEAGPEAVVPLDKMGGSGGIGGSTYNITVNAGVGDPGTIGQSVVDAITAYERRNGAGWRAA